MSRQLALKERITKSYWSIVGMAIAVILSIQPIMADTIWDRFSTIMKDVYGQLVGISTINADTTSSTGKPDVQAGTIIRQNGGTLNAAHGTIIEANPANQSGDNSTILGTARAYTPEQIAAAQSMAKLLDAYAKAWNAYDSVPSDENFDALMGAFNALLDEFLKEGGAADILAALGTGADRQTLSHFRDNEAELSGIGANLRSVWREAAAPLMNPGLKHGSDTYINAFGAAGNAAGSAAGKGYSFMCYLIDLLTEMGYYPIPQTAN